MSKKQTNTTKKPSATPRARPARRGPSRWVIPSTAVLLIAVAALFALNRPGARGANSSNAAVQASSVSPEVLEAGAEYYQTNCAVCHGVGGEGNAQAGIPAPPLNGSAHSWHHADDQIIGLIRNGGVVMPAVGADWSDEQVHAVLAHVKNWWEPWQRETQPGTIGE